MIVKRHVWKTATGDLVRDGHADAAFLAYPAGTDVPDLEASRVGLTPELAGYPPPDPEPEPEPEPAAEVKQVTAHEDKAASPPTRTRRR